MTNDEWESLCDHCGKCCLYKLEDEDSGDVYYTSVVCDLYDLKNSRCSCYQQRCQLVPEYLDLKQHDFSLYNCLPATCAYRLLSEGKPLPDWHPLVSGNADSVHQAGVAIRSYAMKAASIDDPQDHIIEWLK